MTGRGVFAAAGCVVLAFGIGCARHGSGASTGGDDATGTPTPVDAWTIDVDMSSLDRFVPIGTQSWPVGGAATASAGLASVDVAGAAAPLQSGGAFTSSVAVTPGLDVVPVVARDDAGHQRLARRSLIDARFLPEGTQNDDGARLILSNAILASMGQGLASQAAAVDVAGEIMSRTYLSQDSQCSTWPLAATQGTVSVALALDNADLWLHIQVPDLNVDFGGECQGLISTIPIAGNMGGTIDLWTKVSPQPSGDGTCLTRFSHTTPQTAVAGWYFGVWGTGGPLQNWIVDLFSGSKDAQALDELETEVGTQGDTILTSTLADVSVFDDTSSLQLLGRPVNMHLCVADLPVEGGHRVARIGASASGAGTRPAPGAPQTDGAAPAVAANELLLDGNLVGQLLFSSWRDGGLKRTNVDSVGLDILGVLVPQLLVLYPDATTANVSIDGELPPLVTTTPGGTGDVRVAMGDLMVDLTVGTDRIFRFGVTLTLDLDLVPQDGALVPTVVATDADVVLLDEITDGPDDLLASAVKTRIGAAATTLLDGTTLSLPVLPGMGTPVGVTADPGGRFLRIALQ